MMKAEDKRTYAKRSFTQEESLYFQLVLIFYTAKPRIPESQIHFLVYLYLYPDTFKNKLIEDGRFLSTSAVSNAQSILLKYKILTPIPDAKAKNLAYVYDINAKLKQALKLGDFESITSIRVTEKNSNV